MDVKRGLLLGGENADYKFMIKVCSGKYLGLRRRK
jgi:hypothetical protein